MKLPQNWLSNQVQVITDTGQVRSASWNGCLNISCIYGFEKETIKFNWNFLNAKMILIKFVKHKKVNKPGNFDFIMQLKFVHFKW